jgi:hypothetical protein
VQGIDLQLPIYDSGPFNNFVVIECQVRAKPFIWRYGKFIWKDTFEAAGAKVVHSCIAGNGMFEESVTDAA